MPASAAGHWRQRNAVFNLKSPLTMHSAWEAGSAILPPEYLILEECLCRMTRCCSTTLGTSSHLCPSSRLQPCGSADTRSSWISGWTWSHRRTGALALAAEKGHAMCEQWAALPLQAQHIPGSSSCGACMLAHAQATGHNTSNLARHRSLHLTGPGAAVTQEARATRLYVHLEGGLYNYASPFLRDLTIKAKP